MPIQIQTATGWRRLQKAFSIVGRHRLMLDEVVVPVAILEDLTLQQDTANDRATIAIQCLAAGAGTLSASVFSNLTQTGAILLLDRIYVTLNAAMRVAIIQTTIAPILPIAASAIQKTWNDPTQPGEPPGTGFANDGVFAAGDVIYEGLQLANTPFMIEVNQIVPPGNQVVVQPENNNTAHDAVFQYRVSASRD